MEIEFSGTKTNQKTRRTIFVISFILGLGGAIVVLILNVIQDHRLSNSPLIDIENNILPNYDRVIGITDTSYKVEYLDYVLNYHDKKVIGFPFETMRTNVQVYLLEYNVDSSLILVARKATSNLKNERHYHELWISPNYVVEE
ncbi:MAG: hypothetical protein N4A46_06795 [Schleiferiaceae bacterium]|jgi:hypothetical protein|nr:hypothetical protein [Schleiferiaceae bacterium]